MFDYGIQDKLRREHEAHARYLREVEPILRKVYDSPEPPSDLLGRSSTLGTEGPPIADDLFAFAANQSAIANQQAAIANPPSAIGDRPSAIPDPEKEWSVYLYNSLSPAKRRRVEQLYAEWELWMGVAKDLHVKANAQLRPAFPRFSTVCAMLDTAFTLGRLATGLETNLKEDPHAQLFARDVNADLERIYGNHAPVHPHSELVDAPREAG